jgi:hypothetical protein
MIATLIKAVVDGWTFASVVIADVRAARKDLHNQFGHITE